MTFKQTQLAAALLLSVVAAVAVVGPASAQTTTGRRLSDAVTGKTVAAPPYTSGDSIPIIRDGNIQKIPGDKLLTGGDASSSTITATGGTTARTLADRAGDTITPLDYGAKCDVIEANTASMTSGSNVLTLSSGTVAATAQGKRIVVTGVGAGPFSALTRASTLGLAGTGYVANEKITLNAGTGTVQPVIQVLTVDGGGAVLTWDIIEAGQLTAPSANPVAQASTTGVGTGATFNLSWVGAPVYGTIASADGTASITLSNAGSEIQTTRTGVTFWYGTDDKVELQDWLDALKSTGATPGTGKVKGFCGTTAQLELPAVGSGTLNTGQGGIEGDSKTFSGIYALAPMTAILHRDNSFGWGGGASNMSLVAGGLATYGVYTEGGFLQKWEDLYIRDAITEGFRCGNETDHPAQQHIERLFYRTDPWAFSQRQMADYGVNLHSFCTDSIAQNIEVSGAKLAAVRDAGAGNEIRYVNLYGSPDPGYCPTYGTDMSARGTVIGGQIGCATTAGTRINAADTTVIGTYTNLFRGLPDAKGILIESGKCNVTVVANKRDSNSNVTNDNLVSQSGTPCASTVVMNNPGATYATPGVTSGLLLQEFASITNPAGGTTSTSQVNAGIGGTVSFVAPSTGRVKITITGQASNTTNGNGGFMQIRTGTGTAPNYDGTTAATGTAIGRTLAFNSGANFAVPFSISAVADDLTAGTTYWADLGFAATANTASLKNLSAVIEGF